MLPSLASAYALGRQNGSIGSRGGELWVDSFSRPGLCTASTRQLVLTKKPAEAQTLEESTLMSRRAKSVIALLLCVATVLTGCSPQQPFYFHEDGDLSHYVDVATDIEYPDTPTCSLDDVTNAAPPLSLDNPTPREMWDLKLEEAIKLTLGNSKVMRSLSGRFISQASLRAQTGDAPDALITNPEAIRTVYDPAIVETSPFGAGILGIPGTEAALAAFDAQLSSNLFATRNNRQQNVGGGQFQQFFVRTFEQDTDTFNAQIAKTTATGGQFTVSSNTVYDANNNPTRQVYSDWDQQLQMGFSQPLLQGSGVQYNRIAGPNSPFTGVGTAQFDGVMLARINTDITLADFEAGVRNLVSDAENSYWELYFSYRNLEAAKAGRASALQTWQKIYALYQQGGRGGELDKEAQAREQFFFFHSQVQTALNDLYRAENRLRYMMGIAVSDGRLIRPADEPTTAHVVFDWYEVHSEALSRVVELRRQRWRIKERELELIAARSLLQPRLDAAGYYRWRGLGDELLNYRPDGDHNGLINTNAFGELTDGKYQEWQLGLQFQMPIGFRRELSAIRHYQLLLARERSRLQDQELEVSHQLGDAIRNIDANYDLAQTNFNRRVAAEKQVEAVKAAFEADTVTLDLLLDAQRRRADAEVAYYRSLVDYMRGVTLVHFRKGSLLEYNGVYLAEGPWPNKAYFDAQRMAQQRDASYYLDYGYTRPKVISQGTYLQHKQDAEMADDSAMLETPMEGMPGDMGNRGPTPEEVPAPLLEPKGDAAPKPMPKAKSAKRPMRPVAPGQQRHAAVAPHVATPPTVAEAAPSDDKFEWGELGTSKPQPQPQSRVVIKSTVNSTPAPTTEKPRPAASSFVKRTSFELVDNEIGSEPVSVSKPAEVEAKPAKVEAEVRPASRTTVEWQSKSASRSKDTTTKTAGGASGWKAAGR
jgi:outer membrane protein TolC